MKTFGMSDVNDWGVSEEHTGEGSAVDEPVAGLPCRLICADDVSVSHDDGVLRGRQAGD